MSSRKSFSNDRGSLKNSRSKAFQIDEAGVIPRFLLNGSQAPDVIDSRELGGDKMHVGYVTYVLRLYGISSLKEKRSIIRPILSDLRRNFNASVVETGKHDSKLEAEITVSMVACKRSELDSLFQSVWQRMIWNGVEVYGEEGEIW